MDKKESPVSPKRLDKKSASCSSFHMDSSLFVNDELEISSNKSKRRTKVDQDSNGKRISEIISSNSGKILRAGKECINY